MVHKKAISSSSPICRRRNQGLKSVSRSHAVISLKYFAPEPLADVITTRAGGGGKGEGSLFQQKWWRQGRGEALEGEKGEGGEALEAGPKEPAATSLHYDLMIGAS